MEKFLIALLIIVTLGLGYWLAVGTNTEPAKPPQAGQTEKIPDTSAQTPSAQTQEQQSQQTQTPAVNTKDKNINNKVDNKKNMTAILHTNKGNITIEFNPNTPKTVENFISLAKSGFYDGTKFHRVIKGFMSQGGDPLSKDDGKQSLWGTGGPGYKFADELSSSNHNNLGTISMANAGPNTNGSQFFINAANNNFLDTKHVVFGKIISGLDVATAINLVKTDSSDRPLDPVILQSITLK